MIGNGAMNLARALESLTETHTNTQLLLQGKMLNTIWDNFQMIEASTKNLDKDQMQVDIDEQSAATGVGNGYIKLAKARSEYQVASTNLNNAMGMGNGVTTKLDLEVHVQSQNLGPAYNALKYTALIFLTTSGLINKFKE